MTSLGDCAVGAITACTAAGGTWWPAREKGGTGGSRCRAANRIKIKLNDPDRFEVESE